MRMSESLSARVDRIFAWADRVQRQHGLLGFRYAVIKKYGDDDGGREAALITYYGFLSIFPLLLLLGALAAGALTVVVTALPGLPGAERAVAVPGSAAIIFAVLLFGARLLLARPAPARALWPAAVLGAAALTLVLNLGAPLLAGLVRKAGPVYGSFATVAGMFGLLYLVSQALVYPAEVAAVRFAGLWPRALGLNRPTVADARALALLAREQERIPAARVEFRLVPPDPPPAGKGPPGSGPP